LALAGEVQHCGNAAFHFRDEFTVGFDFIKRFANATASVWE